MKLWINNIFKTIISYMYFISIYAMESLIDSLNMVVFECEHFVFVLLAIYRKTIILIIY